MIYHIFTQYVYIKLETVWEIRGYSMTFSFTVQIIIIIIITERHKQHLVQGLQGCTNVEQ